MKGLKEYLVKSKSGLLTLDFGKIMGISNRDFRKIHFEENMLFLDSHAKLTGHLPFCEYCEGNIEKPEELIREHGGSSHVYCFESIYESELRENFCEEEQKYFDRLLMVLKN